MLATEHILIVPFANQLQSQLYEHNRALEYTISFLSLISNSTELRQHGISALQKALDVSGKHQNPQCQTFLTSTQQKVLQRDGLFISAVVDAP